MSQIIKNRAATIISSHTASKLKPKGSKKKKLTKAQVQLSNLSFDLLFDTGASINTIDEIT